MQTQLTNQNGTAVKVTKEGELATFSIVETESQHELRLGNAHNANTGWITLTSANQSGVAFIQNNGDKKLIITSVVYGFGPSTGGTPGYPVDIELLRNPTGGTIVSGALQMDYSPTIKSTNKNFGSSNTLDVIAYKGAEGNTLTGDDGGMALIGGYVSGRVAVSEVSFELQKGTSVGVLITPPPGNTSMRCYVAFAVFVAEDLY